MLTMTTFTTDHLRLDGMKFEDIYFINKLPVENRYLAGGLCYKQY